MSDSVMASLLSSIRWCFFVSRAVGMGPVRWEHRDGILRPRAYLSVLYVLQVALQCIAIVYMAGRMINHMQGSLTSLHSFDAMQLFACCMAAAHVLSMQFKVIEYRHIFTSLLDLFMQVDQQLKTLGIIFIYKEIVYACKVFIGLVCTVLPLVLYFAFYNEGHILVLILLVWRGTAINQFFFYVYLVYIKYRKMNKFLKLFIEENEKGLPMTGVNISPLEVINTIANVYDKLCSHGKRWNTMHNTPLSINLLFYAIGLTIYSVSYYVNPTEMKTMIPVVVFLIFEFFYVLTISQITRSESQKIILNINDMSCCYVDSELWRARNSFLLQTIHQQVNFTALHVIPLDHSLAIKIGGIVLSVLVLSIQIRSLQYDQ